MKILDLPLPFATPPGIILPSFDEFGVPHGAAYESFKDARNGKISTRTTFRGLKFKRRFEALSLNEQRALFCLGFNPYVVDIRDQYPIYSSSDFDEAVLRGRRMAKNSVMTIDIVVTVVLPPDFSIHYHGISIKDAAAKLDGAAERRQLREQSALAERKWSWELIRGDQFQNMTYTNCFALYRCVRDTDVFSYYREAKAFAVMLAQSSMKGALDSVLARASKRIGISLDMAHRLFAIAAAFGFITIDHSKPLRVDAPLHLIL